MSDSSEQLREKFTKWVGLIGLPQEMIKVPAAKFPATMALLEHMLADAESHGVIDGYKIEVIDSLDGKREVRATVRIPTVLDKIEISLDRTSVAMPDAEVPAAGHGMEEF